MSSSMMPAARPQISKERALAILVANFVDTNEPALLGMRGYFRDSMGKKGVQDRGIYDDAIIVVTPTEFQAFNANTDPSRIRRGYGKAESTKGMANLVPGVHLYEKGMHRGSYWALTQAGPVQVLRDGRPDYLDEGWFGINIHKGGKTTTSSLGCQTIPPDQWAEFKGLVYRVMDKYDVSTIPYCLVEQQG